MCSLTYVLLGKLRSPHLHLSQPDQGRGKSKSCRGEGVGARIGGEGGGWVFGSAGGLATERPSVRGRTPEPRPFMEVVGS